MVWTLVFMMSTFRRVTLAGRDGRRRKCVDRTLAGVRREVRSVWHEVLRLFCGKPFQYVHGHGVVLVVKAFAQFFSFYLMKCP